MLQEKIGSDPLTLQALHWHQQSKGHGGDTSVNLKKDQHTMERGRASKRKGERESERASKIDIERERERDCQNHREVHSLQYCV